MKQTLIVSAAVGVASLLGMTVVEGRVLAQPAAQGQQQPQQQTQTQTQTPTRTKDRPSPPASTAAERQARGDAAAKAFVQGQYDAALAIYLDLYAQSGGRPEYLRNIGRCQQKLKQYEPAIESFKEYLRRAKQLSREEKAEVQGFITEMDAARASETNKSAAVATAPTPPPSTFPAPAATSSLPGANPVGPGGAAAAQPTPPTPNTRVIYPPQAIPKHTEPIRMFSRSRAPRRW